MFHISNFIPSFLSNWHLVNYLYQVLFYVSPAAPKPETYIIWMSLPKLTTSPPQYFTPVRSAVVDIFTLSLCHFDLVNSKISISGFIGITLVLFNCTVRNILFYFPVMQIFLFFLFLSGGSFTFSIRTVFIPNYLWIIPFVLTLNNLLKLTVGTWTITRAYIALNNGMYSKTCDVRPSYGTKFCGLKWQVVSHRRGKYTEMIDFSTFRMVSHWRLVSHRSGLTSQVSLYLQLTLQVQK